MADYGFAAARDRGDYTTRFWVNHNGSAGEARSVVFAPPIFDQWEALEKHSKRHMVEAKQVLQLQDELPSSVVVIRSGVVKLVRLQPNGSESILGLRSSGWLMLPASTILYRPSPLSVVTLTPCAIQTISRIDFMQELDINPELTKALTVLMSLEMEAEQQQQIALRSGSAESRLRRLMKEISAGTDGYSMDIPLKKFEIAQLLSITPEHLSRLLHGSPDIIPMRSKS